MPARFRTFSQACVLTLASGLARLRHRVLLGFERVETERDRERLHAHLTFVVVDGAPPASSAA